MSKFAVANESCKINYTPVVVPSDAIYAGDIPYTRTGITFTLATKMKCVNKFVLLDKLAYAWVVESAPCPFTSTLYTFVKGSGNVNHTSLKTKCESKFPLRLNDAGTCTGSWTLVAPPYTTLTCSCTVKISDAGQTKVLSE